MLKRTFFAVAASVLGLELIYKVILKQLTV
jgi:hypothetical protein